MALSCKANSTKSTEKSMKKYILWQTVYSEEEEGTVKSSTMKSNYFMKQPW
jgi:hypothetical protein